MPMEDQVSCTIDDLWKGKPLQKISNLYSIADEKIKAAVKQLDCYRYYILKCFINVLKYVCNGIPTTILVK